MNVIAVLWHRGIIHIKFAIALAHAGRPILAAAILAVSNSHISKVGELVGFVAMHSVRSGAIEVIAIPTPENVWICLTASDFRII
jgi:hypothetical protein